ncbi:hypothetical protein TREAZ_2147 [Leadbettera azotonutricia ZAS-9]|uniref:Uncharacterized protein n=1 Tax=Leadbettera azotonutricia (strain ATCC BAA-888 / DSM 13862 / ZAS-9) TaxID=545695 RepID=F5Y9B4_LEAAZ|nr:hypothetical protein TREAZ_2147 [Leadbettera azotonutricia ZAS-9]
MFTLLLLPDKAATKFLDMYINKIYVSLGEKIWQQLKNDRKAQPRFGFNDDYTRQVID